MEFSQSMREGIFHINHLSTLVLPGLKSHLYCYQQGSMAVMAISITKQYPAEDTAWNNFMHLKPNYIPGCYFRS